MNEKELGKLYPIKIVDYNPQWPFYFRKEKELIIKILDKNIRIEHIGSTAVKGLSAKPTIDILIEKPESITSKEIITKFEKNSYIHMKEQTKHLMLVKGYTPMGLKNISYHLHIGPLQQKWLWDRLYFRDYLLKFRHEAKKYEDLKLKLAKKHKFNREQYTEAKTDYINKITEKAKLIFDSK